MVGLAGQLAASGEPVIFSASVLVSPVGTMTVRPPS